MLDVAGDTSSLNAMPGENLPVASFPVFRLGCCPRHNANESPLAEVLRWDKKVQYFEETTLHLLMSRS
jgi:hypothetical protein